VLPTVAGPGGRAPLASSRERLFWTERTFPSHRSRRQAVAGAAGERLLCRVKPVNAANSYVPLLRGSIWGTGFRMGAPETFKKNDDRGSFNSWAAAAIWIADIKQNTLWRADQGRLRRLPRKYIEPSRQAPRLRQRRTSPIYQWRRSSWMSARKTPDITQVRAEFTTISIRSTESRSGNVGCSKEEPRRRQNHHASERGKQSC
jgi:hypothetical protein